MANTQVEVTRLLVDWNQGNQRALEQLTPMVYTELRRLADRHLRRERPGPTLQHGARPRGVDEAYRPAQRAVAEPRSFLWRGGAVDPADSGGLCTQPARGQARRARLQAFTRRSHSRAAEARSRRGGARRRAQRPGQT